MDRVREIIAGLRNDQSAYEERRLQNGSDMADRASAFRLAALYNWAKATETLATYMIQGEPSPPFSTLDKHFEAGIRAAAASGDAQHEMILRWLHATARIMVTNSLWWATRAVNSRTSDFVRSLTRREHQPMFELLPPQRAALLEQGLLDQAKTAVVVEYADLGRKDPARAVPDSASAEPISGRQGLGRFRCAHSRAVGTSHPAVAHGPSSR